MPSPVFVTSSSLPEFNVTTYEIDGNRFSTLEGFYDEIDRVMHLQTWGRNLSAFNDILRGGFGTPEGGFTLRWKNHGISRERLGYPETVRQLRLRFERCHPSNRERIAADLVKAEQDREQTVYDWLIEIIRRNGQGGEEEQDGVELVLD